MDSREIQPGVTNGRTADSGQIKAEIDHTRERIDDTLDALADKLHPKRLLDEVVDYVRDPSQVSGTASKLAHVLWHQIRQHPMPSLLIGAGIAWALSENSRRGDQIDMETGTWVTGKESPMRRSAGRMVRSVGRKGRLVAGQIKEKTGAVADSVREKGGEIAHTMREKAGEIAHTVREKSGEFAQSVRDKTGEVAHSVREKSETMAHSVRERSGAMADTVKEKGREQAMRFKEATSQMTTQTRERASAAMHRAEETWSTATMDYPLALGLGFLAVGVMAGLVLPHTGVEDRALGERADLVKDRVREQGRQAVATAQHAASAVAHAASEEAQRQGLTPQNIAEKIKHVASDAARAAADSAQREGLDTEGLKQRVQTVAQEAKKAAKDEVKTATITPAV